MTKKRISEQDGYWVIRPHPELAVTEVDYGDRGEVIEIAKKGGKVYAREIRFPKSKWSKKAVEETAAANGECPYCTDGVPEHETVHARPVDWWRIGGAVVGTAAAVRIAHAVDTLRASRGPLNAKNVVLVGGVAMLVWAGSKRSAASPWRTPAAVAGLLAVAGPFAVRWDAPRAVDLPSSRPPEGPVATPFRIKEA